MKAKFNISILIVLMISGFSAKAQISGYQDFRNDGPGVIVNNYYDDYDYYFSSRINRFHRSYAAFDYYAPVFTDTYWYNYQPYSRGLSIYGGSGFGMAYSVNYPVYSYDYGYGYNSGWYDPYYGSSYSWGYNPFFHSGWYSPVIVNINIGNRWHNNYYGWNGYGRNYRYNDYRPAYNTYNNNYYNYSSSRYSSSSNTSGSRYSSSSEPNPVNGSRRAGSVENGNNINSRNTGTNAKPADNIDNGKGVTTPGQVNRSVNVRSNTDNNRSTVNSPARTPSNANPAPSVNRRTEVSNPGSNRTMTSPAGSSSSTRATSAPAGSSSSTRAASAPARSSSSTVKSSSSSENKSKSGTSSSGERSTRRR